MDQQPLQSEPPPDHRIFHHSLLEQMHPTIDWEDNESREEKSKKNSGEDVE